MPSTTWMSVPRLGVPPRRQARLDQAAASTWHGIYGPLFEWRKKFPDDRPEAVKDFAAMTHAYWGTILSVDDSVGKLYAVLKESGQAKTQLNEGNRHIVTYC